MALWELMKLQYKAKSNVPQKQSQEDAGSQQTILTYFRDQTSVETESKKKRKRKEVKIEENLDKMNLEEGSLV